jgi:hypothetical protein
VIKIEQYTLQVQIDLPNTDSTDEYLDSDDLFERIERIVKAGVNGIEAILKVEVDSKIELKVF